MEAADGWETVARYAHVLFALKDRDLGMLEANFASNICDFFDFLRQGWGGLTALPLLGIVGKLMIMVWKLQLVSHSGTYCRILNITYDVMIPIDAV